MAAHGPDTGAPDAPKLTDRLTETAMRWPTMTIWLVVAAVVVAGLGFIRLQVDTDPENMLPTDDPVRLRNAVLDERFGAGPMIVVGLFGDVRGHEELAGLARVHAGLAARPDVDGNGTFSAASTFDGMPSTSAEAVAVVDRVQSDPVLGENVLFDDGAAIFVALVDKGVATDVADAAEALVAAEPALAGVELVVAGQPLAEDAFGSQMFIQMAVFAPLAGLLVFVVLLVFFRRLQLVLPAMAVAVATVGVTMGALVGAGNTLHIMSSMIPIFLMPIAILDSVHVLSEFFDRYDGHDRAAVLRGVLRDLRRPIGYTSLTTAVGFGALVLVPIPPVRLFGLFVAIGVGLAWLFTMTLLPAYLLTVDERRLIRPTSAVGRLGRLGRVGGWIGRRRAVVLGAFALVGLLSVPALATIDINDNPVRWFRADQEVRVATERLGDALPGTFTASLIVTEAQPGQLDDPATQAALAGLVEHLVAQEEVGAAQSYLTSDHPMFRSGSQANVRLQLRTGDNTAMQAVVDAADAHLIRQPIGGVTVEWAGEAYLNLTWQQKMVSGMLVGFATTLVAIFLLLVALFRSVRWAALAMVPVLWTVLVVYGAMAAFGRDVDMPVAVLSTMVLGIGVDFAIHFVERYRSLLDRTGSATAALARFYGEPARAMTRNAVVIGVGFSPLVLSSLVPYVVVGVLLASIVGLSWLSTIVLLPAAVYRVDPPGASVAGDTPVVALPMGLTEDLAGQLADR